MSAPDDLGEWAALYRDARRPPPALAARVLRELDRDGFGPNESPDDAVAEHANHNAHPKERWGLGLMAGALIGIAALLALTWSMDAIRVTPAVDSGAVEAPLQAAPGEAPGGAAVGRERPHRATAPAVETPSEPAGPSVSSPRALPAPAKPRPSAKQPPQPAAQPKAQAGSVDLESMRRLRAAEALLERDALAARKALEQHARDYPRSPMMLEREALWIRAACASGATNGLERRRKAFFQRADVNAYRDAILRACE